MGATDNAGGLETLKASRSTECQRNAKPWEMKDDSFGPEDLPHYRVLELQGQSPSLIASNHSPRTCIVALSAMTKRKITMSPCSRVPSLGCHGHSTERLKRGSRIRVFDPQKVRRNSRIHCPVAHPPPPTSPPPKNNLGTAFASAKGALSSQGVVERNM